MTQWTNEKTRMCRYLAVQNTSSRSLDPWQTMQIVPNDTLCVTVYQLQPSTAYQFMVMSRNRHGDAMYSQPVATSTKGIHAMQYFSTVRPDDHASRSVARSLCDS